MRTITDMLHEPDEYNIMQERTKLAEQYPNAKYCGSCVGMPSYNNKSAMGKLYESAIEKYGNGYFIMIKGKRLKSGWYFELYYIKPKKRGL